MKSSPESLELQFLRTFKDYIYYFNMLERNIVYCLSHAKKGNNYSETADKFSSISFDEKVRKLRNLIKENKLEKAFVDWFASVDLIRSMRNKIVHGQWETYWPYEDPISFDIPAPRNERGRMKMEEFLKEFEYLKGVTDSFSKLRKQFEIKEQNPNKAVERNAEVAPLPQHPSH